MKSRASTYDGGGRTLRAPGRTALVGHGAAVWEFAGAEVLRWGVKTRSGFSLEVARPVAVGDRYWIVAHLGPVRIHEPVEVVAVVDEVDRKGFAYSTLEGHPIRGEEAFAVERRADDSVWLTISSESRPARGLRAGLYPVARLAQPFYQRRYLRSLGR